MPTFLITDFTMVQVICNGCNRYFKAGRGLSNHFQFNKECKAIHLNLNNHYHNISNKKAQEERDKKMKAIKPLKELNIKQDEDNHENNDICNTNQDSNGEESSNDTAPFASMPTKEEEPKEPINTFMFTNEIRVENNLLKLVSDMNATNDAFKNIVEWAKDAFSTGYQFNPKTINYRNQIMQMEKYSNLKPIRPFNKPVLIPNSLDDPTDTSLHQVVCCNFTSMLISLLQDKNINGIENLVVNEKDPFSKYVSNNGKLGEINSGSWYEQAYKTMVKDPDKDFLLPIIFAMDKTTISSTARMSVYAVMFTTTLFDYKTRNKAQAWRPLGYIPIEKNFHSSAQWTRMDKKLKSKRENLFFETVLHSFREAQQDGALDGVPLTLGNKTKAVNLKVPLAFIIGDILGGDGICGRSAYYRADAKHICRMCDATPAAYISTDMDCCNMLVMEDIRQLCLNKDEDKLESMLQSVNYQAFYDIDYGGSPGGVFTAACPPEALHSLENGIVLHCLKQLFEEILGQPARANLDDIVQQWLKHPKQCHMKSYMAAFPRLLFKDGLTTITDISAGTKIGILFAFVLAAQTNEGRYLLMKHNKTASIYGDMI